MLDKGLYLAHFSPGPEKINNKMKKYTHPPWILPLQLSRG